MNRPRPLNTSPLPVRLRVEDYLMLDAAGAFDDYAKTELIEGEIIYMNAQHRPHARIKSRLYSAIDAALRDANSPLGALVEVSVAAEPDNAPEPDIVVTREPDGEGLVPVETVALIVEVADTTLDNDLGRKAALYASLSIPEYWVADVNGRVIHQKWMPVDGAYTEAREVAFGERITAVTVGSLRIETSGL